MAFEQAPWVGQSDWDYLGWETEEEEYENELKEDEYLDRLIDEVKEGKILKGDKV